ncbi:MAG: hypothetical protein Q9181_008141, partial [Wetmoreana brouardii]
ILLFKNETKEYAVRPCRVVLMHEDHEGYAENPFVLLSDPGSDPNDDERYRVVLEEDVQDVVMDNIEHPQTFSMKSAVGRSGGGYVPCVFVALGYLAEDVRSDSTNLGARNRTNYVVMLNLSTDPASIWVMYDYHMDDWLESRIRWTNRLGEYSNNLYFSQKERYQEFPKIEDEFEVGSGGGLRLQDFRKRYTNLNDKRPRFKKEASDTTSPAVSNGPDDSLTMRDQRTASEDKKGYFGLPQFDLALVAPDFYAWSSDGLDQPQVKRCLDNSHVRLGSSLRARRVGVKDLIPQKRVCTKELCF